MAAKVECGFVAGKTLSSVYTFAGPTLFSASELRSETERPAIIVILKKANYIIYICNSTFT